MMKTLVADATEGGLSEENKRGIITTAEETRPMVSAMRESLRTSEYPLSIQCVAAVIFKFDYLKTISRERMRQSSILEQSRARVANLKWSTLRANS